MNKVFVFLLAFLAMRFASFAFTQNGSTFTCDGSIPDANYAYSAMAAGDTLIFPSGTFTWGTNNEGLLIQKPINVLGSGTGQTFFLIDPNSTLPGIFILESTGTIGNFTAIATNGGAATGAVSPQNQNGWRITNINFDCVTHNSSSFFVLLGNAYGLIDHCTMNQGTVASEFIFGHGDPSAWQEPNNEGTSNAVIIENCTVNGPPGSGGYLTDANSNEHFVVRYCTFNGEQKIDAHGFESDTPARACRCIEIYGNTWTLPNMNANAMELRGGTGMVFNNTIGSGWLEFNTYSAFENIYPVFNDTYQTPVNYPIPDQIGMGEDVPVGASPQGINTPAGFAKSKGGAEPFYVWSNTVGGVSGTFGAGPIPANAQPVFQAEKANKNAVYTMTGPLSAAATCITAEGRDYFQQGGYYGTAAFTGTDGVGVGTYAQMISITPTVNRVGFWVTDRGNWNTTLSGTNSSGELFVASNGAWGSINPAYSPGNGQDQYLPAYIPYQYPDPRISGTVIVPNSVGTTGTSGSSGSGTSGGNGTGGWLYSNGAWIFSPYTSTPANLPPAPTGLRVNGS